MPTDETDTGGETFKLQLVVRFGAAATVLEVGAVDLEGAAV